MKTSEAPHNLSAEAGVLGAILYDNAAYYRVRDILRAEVFYSLAHRAIWEAVESHIRDGRVADGVTLREWFEGESRLSEIGGAGYLAELLEAAALGPETVDYAAMVANLWKRRQLIEMGTALRNGASESGKPDTLISDHERALEALREQAGNRRPVVSVSDVTDDEIFGMGEDALVRTGFKTLDDRIGGFARGAVTVLGAGPGTGKTTSSICIMTDIAQRGESVGFISADMNRGPVMQRFGIYQMWRAGGRAPTVKELVMGRLGPHELSQVAAAARAPHMRNVFIDDTGGITTDDINAQIRDWKRHARRNGLPPLGAVFIDHIGQILPATGSTRQYEKTTQVSNELLAVAKQHPRTAIVELAQISRDGPRSERRPRKSDLRDSGHIEQDATTILLLHREEDRLRVIAENEQVDRDARERAQTEMLRHLNKIEVIIDKNRNSSLGAVVLEHQLERGVIFDSQARYEMGAA